LSNAQESGAHFSQLNDKLGYVDIKSLAVIEFISRLHKKGSEPTASERLAHWAHSLYPPSEGQAVESPTLRPTDSSKKAELNIRRRCGTDAGDVLRGGLIW
jgi:hypothetical protein